ncbi:uncharacterized protein LOC121705076 isoform X2 [Alosa sapidissima]|uniref:uncharacterized protein LOC121705076 isoform X2 n=1 Tax=Alosa sapidissima TaxID=34773 RepID=UPI001C085FF3|nr:uncharacterized protein LOC121705076 isoform X2 [Alosa sapidissima]
MRQEMAHLQQEPTANPRLSSRRPAVRPMHESTLTLTDSTDTNYTTVMAESYSGRDSRGQPLIFFLRDPPFPSQHDSKLDLSNALTTYTATHSRNVHSPKDIIPYPSTIQHNVLHSSRNRNWTRSHEGLAMKEVTNPTGSTLFRSSYRDSHQNPSLSIGHGVSPMGHPISWHSHDILTGEDKRPAGPGKPKTARDDSLQAQRHWETDSSTLRLY